MNILSESANEIAWHTQTILQHGDNPEPLVLLARIEMLRMTPFKSLFIPVSTRLICNNGCCLEPHDLDVQDANYYCNHLIWFRHLRFWIVLAHY